MMSVNKLLARRYKVMGEYAPLFYDQPIHIVKGQGVWLYDIDGTKYLDMYNNVPTVGHCNPYAVKRITEQVQTLNVHTRYLHETIVEYSERLLATFDQSLDMLVMTCTGSESNDIAIRMAREHTGKMGIICTDDAYHGNTTVVDEIATQFHQGQVKGCNVKSIPTPDSYRPLDGLTGTALGSAYADKVKQAIDEFNAEGIGFAAMLICPILANEAIPVIPEKFIELAAQHVRDAGGLVIFDEVQSGFGRTGSMWGYQQTGVVPDIVTLGKPMGNGHPVAGVVTSTKLMDEFRSRSEYFNTFGGNPVSSAAALAVLDVIQKDNLIENARKIGAYLKDGLEQLKEKYQLIGDVRQRGLFIVVELVLDLESKEPAPEAAHAIVESMKSQGILLSKTGIARNALKMRPPIVFNQENADQVLSALNQALNELN
ncbi:aspartate aminotransferase family protein [uncultured Psychromonas sp.]|uniref:aspartate aminotransferase family protein n=1 Tax=uncultured Psychromonas sp. TaxID=173974 RepID=UPI0026230A49|nr:aspartate aminotransferase family protein [uncultured Psychromonas sp.]